MPEPIETSIEPTPADLTAELETLRRTNAELTIKARDRKAKIVELEAGAAVLQAKATDAEATIKEVTVNGPFKAMAASLSTAPDALRDAMSKDYKLESRDGVLTLLNVVDDTPVMHEGRAVPFERNAIKDLLLSTKDEGKRQLYSAILIASHASGAAGKTGQRIQVPDRQKMSFGLR